MKRTITSKMPESGQFVAIWRIDGKIWSHTYMVESRKVYSFMRGAWMYICNKDEFLEIMPSGPEIIQ